MFDVLSPGRLCASDLCQVRLTIIAHRRDGRFRGAERRLQRPTVPFAPCRETRSSSATEPPSGDSSTLSSSSGGEPASEATF